MNSKAAKLLVVESDDALRKQIVAVLSDAGYEVSADYREGMKTVLAFDPDAVVLGADPPQLDCCDLLSEIKGSEHTHNIRVVMLSPGGSAERTRGLDLRADDVLSLAFDSHELLSRVRSQLRNKSNAGRISRAAAPCRGKSKCYPAGGDSGQRRTADAASWRTSHYYCDYRCRTGLCLLLPSRPGTEYPSLCGDHSIADWRTDATTVDGTIASSQSPRGRALVAE